MRQYKRHYSIKKRKRKTKEIQNIVLNVNWNATFAGIRFADC